MNMKMQFIFKKNQPYKSDQVPGTSQANTELK